MNVPPDSTKAADGRTTRRRVRKRRDLIAALSLTVGIVAVAGLIGVLLWPTIGGAHAATAKTAAAQPTLGVGEEFVPTDQPPEPSPGQSAPPTSAPAAPVVLKPNQPTHLSMPALGLEVNVGQMSVPAGQAVDPPTMGSAYWLSEYGQAGPGPRTAYIAGHTCRGDCSAAFSPFLDIPTSTYRVKKGDQVIVTTPTAVYAYTVTAVELYQKTTIQSQAELWRNVAGRLVLVTCFQYYGGTSSQQNLVIYTQLNGTPSPSAP